MFHEKVRFHQIVKQLGRYKVGNSLPTSLKLFSAISSKTPVTHRNHNIDPGRNLQISRDPVRAVSGAIGGLGTVSGADLQRHDGGLSAVQLAKG